MGVGRPPPRPLKLFVGHPARREKKNKPGKSRGQASPPSYIPTCWRANILLASAQYEETQWGTTC